MRTFTVPAGLPVGIARRRPAVGEGVRVEEWASRRLGELARVTVEPVSRASRRVQYWMLNGVALTDDLARIDPRLRFELTYMADRPIGWERPKTAGHNHGRPASGSIGFAEVCEILEGTAGFLVQDLQPGPAATFAALVTVRPGERIILPPFLQHLTIDLAGDPLVFSDVISRRITGDYEGLAAAHGGAYLVGPRGEARPNPAYRSLPPLERLTAEGWAGEAARHPVPLYQQLLADPAALAWLDEPDTFPDRFSELWARLRPVYERLPGMAAALARAR